MSHLETKARLSSSAIRGVAEFTRWEDLARPDACISCHANFTRLMPTRPYTSCLICSRGSVGIRPGGVLVGGIAGHPHAIDGGIPLIAGGEIVTTF